MMINPELNVGDKVILLHMEGEMMSPGTKGVVKSISMDPFEDNDKIYSIKWDDGSTLSLLSVTDAWKLDESSQIKESHEDDFKWMIKNKDILENFDTKTLTDYLSKVRDSGVTNMFGAAPFLYLGRERIEHMFKYEDVPNEEAFDDMLEMADKAQRVMINGVMKIFEKQKKELEIGTINRYIQRYASNILNYWIKVF